MQRADIIEYLEFALTLPFMPGDSDLEKVLSVVYVHRLRADAKRLLAELKTMETETYMSKDNKKKGYWLFDRNGTIAWTDDGLLDPLTGKIQRLGSGRFDVYQLRQTRAIYRWVEA